MSTANILQPSHDGESGRGVKKGVPAFLQDPASHDSNLNPLGLVQQDGLVEEEVLAEV